MYVLKKAAGLYGGSSYVQCSYCGHHAFKLYKTVYSRSEIPKHILKKGKNIDNERNTKTSENEIFRFCRNCWYEDGKVPESHEPDVARPYFKRESFGETEHRGCKAWHFIRRDFARQRINQLQTKRQSHVKEDFVNGKENIVEDKDYFQSTGLCQVVSVIGQEGNDYLTRPKTSTFYDKHGHGFEVCDLPHNVLATEGDNNVKCAIDGHLNRQEESFAEEKEVTPSTIYLDHDYVPSVQLEVEIKSSSAASPLKMNKSLQKKKLASKLVKKTIKHEVKMSTSTSKLSVKQGKVQASKKKDVCTRRPTIEDAKVFSGKKLNLTLEEAMESYKSKIQKGEAIDPSEYDICPLVHVPYQQQAEVFDYSIKT